MNIQPSIKSTLDDSANSGVIYHVMAYRSLNKAELVQTVRVFLSGQKKKPKRGSQITIISIIGHDD